MTQAAQLAQYGSNNVGLSFKNRIINGDMGIDQRNAGASVTNNSAQLVFPVDRTFIYGSVSSKFTGQQNAGSVTPPDGFRNYLGCTSSSAYTAGSSEFFVVGQYIEGFNFADCNWGTANAKTVTLSFWVRSSLTGTFGGSLQNEAVNRSYPFTYTISSANTWEQKSITVAGDTTGTWVGATNGIGLRVWFGLGVGSTLSGTAGSWSGSDFRSATGATSVVGTNGATFYITGVQLEKGSVATSFDYLPYGTELQLCMRYYEVAASTSVYTSLVASCYNTTDAYSRIEFKVPKRTSPTIITVGAFGNWSFYSNSSSKTMTGVTPQNVCDTGFQMKWIASSLNQGFAGHVDFTPAVTAANGGGWSASAEL